MQIAVSGASGLVGSRLLAYLSDAGHTVLRVVRRTSGTPGSDVMWNPAAGRIDADQLEGVDAVVHLAGESIAAGRWTAARKKTILESRTVGTRLIAETLGRLSNKPRVLVAASAIGFYGDRGAGAVDEDSKPGSGFLSDVCVAWEAACSPAIDAGIRVVNLRIGVVLSAHGGALARMLPAFRFGLGGVVGSGDQYMSWITREDLVRAITHCLQDESVGGPVNAVSPRAVTNRDFTKALGRTLRRPTIFPLPAPVVRLLFGEMGRELLLSSTLVEPVRLLRSGFEFRHADVETGLGFAISE